MLARALLAEKALHAHGSERLLHGGHRRDRLGVRGSNAPARKRDELATRGVLHQFLEDGVEVVPPVGGRGEVKLREEREGVTGFRVTVGPDGKVADCSVTSSSGSPDLDQATCDNVRRRARFQPATDGEGNPTSGSYSNRIRWVIPKD